MRPSSVRPVTVPTEPSSDALERWVAEVRVAAAVDERRRATWLRRQLDADATLAGVLADQAERAAAVAITTTAGRRHRGELRVVGADFCVVRTTTGTDVVIRTTAVAVVRPAPGDPAPLGEARRPDQRTFADAVAALADLGARVVAMGGPGGEVVRGRLRAVGRDVVTVQLDGDGRAAYLSLGSLTEVSVTDSG